MICQPTTLRVALYGWPYGWPGVRMELPPIPKSEDFAEVPMFLYHANSAEECAMKLKRSLLLYRWAFSLSPIKPYQVSLCELFWRVVLFTPFTWGVLILLVGI